MIIFKFLKSIKKILEIILSFGVIALALGLALGASGISSEAGYAGIGPNFLPLLVSAGLFLCGVECFKKIPANNIKIQSKFLYS
jgi:hypothetical protein